MTTQYQTKPAPYDKETFELLGGVTNHPTISLVATLKQLDRLYPSSRGARQRNIDNTMSLIAQELTRRSALV